RICSAAAESADTDVDRGVITRRQGKSAGHVEAAIAAATGQALNEDRSRVRAGRRLVSGAHGRPLARAAAGPARPPDTNRRLPGSAGGSRAETAGDVEPPIAAAPAD